MKAEKGAVGKEGSREKRRGYNRVVLLTTMCAGEGDLASLRACLLWRPGCTSRRGHFICRYWMVERENTAGGKKNVNKATKQHKNQIRQPHNLKEDREQTMGCTFGLYLFPNLLLLKCDL